MIKNEDKFFKEDLSFLKEPLIEDILRKVKNRFSSKDEQIKALDIAIKNQDERLSRIVGGKLKPIKVLNSPEIKEDKWEKVNKISEDCKLRILKVTKFTLENEGEGSFEQIESDGMRCITYVAQDSHLTPMFIKVPNDPKTHEPITMYKDESLKRKYQKEATDIITSDYMDSMNDKTSKLLAIASKVLLVLLVLANIFLFMHNINRDKAISERESELLAKWQESPVGICQNAIAESSQVILNQIETNQVLIDYAKEVLSEKTNKESTTTGEIKKI